MADQFKLNISAVYTQETPPATFQVYSLENIVSAPKTYESGKFEIAAGTGPSQLCAQAPAGEVTEVCIKSDQPIRISLGGSGSPIMMADVTIFVYKGALTDVWITNQGVNPAIVTYALISE